MPAFRPNPFGIVLAFALVPMIGTAGEPKKPAKKRVAQVTPVEFFQGDTQRLAPHLDFAGTAAFRIDFSSNELPIKLKVVSYRKGEVVKDRGSRFIPFTLEKPGEVTFSIKEVDSLKDRSEYRFVLANRHTVYSSQLKKIEIKEGGFGAQEQLRRAAELREGDLLALWIMTRGEFRPRRFEESFEEHARNAEAAFVLYLAIGEWDPDER